MFSGTLRFNLDPFDETTNERIKNLLHKAGLDYLDLEFKIQEDGKNLSVGEKQLICIIRAILRQNHIVIFDEATANIDVVTE